MTAEEVAKSLNKPRPSGDGWVACCPAHEDRSPSLSISDGEKGIVVKCHAGCTQESVLAALDGQGINIRRANGVNGATKTNGANGHHHDTSNNFNVGILAAAKKLPEEFLHEHYVTDEPGRVAFEYLNADGSHFTTKYRRALAGERGFSVTPGTGLIPYGLWRLDSLLANDGRLVLVEGETDALTLWYHGFTALGIPGANQWKDEWIQHLPTEGKIYVVLEPDDGGKAFEKSFRESKLAPRIHFIRMGHDAKDASVLHCSGPDVFKDAFEERISGAEPAVKPKAARITLRHMAQIMADRKETDWLIDDTIERKVIALMVGARGSLKSFVALDWLMRCAVEGNGAVALSAEGDGLGRRLEAWHRTFAPQVDPASMPLVAMERALSLCVPDIMGELQERLAEVPWKPQILLIDTLSKYSAGLDENENSEVRDFLASLSENLRDVFGCTILLVAHTGYAASERIRGASSFGANTEAEYIVTRPSPTDMVCKVTRERFKDSPPLEPIAYSAEVIDLGRQDKRGRAITSLVLRAGAELPAPKARAGGANQAAALVALREWVVAHPGKDVIPHDELSALLKRQGIGRQRKPEVLNWLVNAGALLPSVGGHKVNSKAVS